MLKTVRLEWDRATVGRLEGKQRRSYLVAAKCGPCRLKPLPARSNQLLNLSLQHRSLQKALRHPSVAIGSQALEGPSTACDSGAARVGNGCMAVIAPALPMPQTVLRASMC